jgi:Fe-S-cluster containining protein
MLLPYTCPHLEYEFAACAIPGDEKEAEKDIRCLCNIHENKPKICQQFNGKRFFNHQLYYVPEGCGLK